jgi:cytochrome c
MRNKAKLSSAIILAALLVSQPLSTAPANAADVAQGRRLASLYCAKCHAIDKVSPSPLTIAPPFRTLHERYPLTALEERSPKASLPDTRRCPSSASSPIRSTISLNF